MIGVARLGYHSKWQIIKLKARLYRREKAQMPKIGCIQTDVLIFIQEIDQQIFLMHQQNSYGFGSQQNNPQQGQFSLNSNQGQFSLNQPQGQFSLNQPQGQHSLNQPQGQFSLNQPQGQSSSNYTQGSTSLNQPQGQSSYNYTQGSTSLNQPQGQSSSNYTQGSTSLSYGQGQQGQFGQGQFGGGSGQEGQNLNYGQGQQGYSGQQPTSSADIAVYMKKMPYTQTLAGEEFTFSVLPKKQSTFFMTNERLLMLKGWDLICYARQFPAGKQLPFMSLADVPAPKTSYPMAQVEKCEVSDDKLIIRFAGPTKVVWEFVCPTKNCAIEWAQRIDSAKATAMRNGMETNYDYRYHEDTHGYDSPDKRGSQSPRQQGQFNGQGSQGQFNANVSYNQPQVSGNTQQYSSTTQQYSPPRHDFTSNRDYSLSTHSNLNPQSNYTTGTTTYSNNTNLGNNTNLANNTNFGGNYSSTTTYSSYNPNLGQNYQTGTPERQQYSITGTQQPSLNINNNYRPGLEVRDNKHSFSTQGQSTISSSSINNPQLSRYPLTGPTQGNEPPRHF